MQISKTANHLHPKERIQASWRHGLCSWLLGTLLTQKDSAKLNLITVMCKSRRMSESQLSPAWAASEVDAISNMHRATTRRITPR